MEGDIFVDGDVNGKMKAVVFLAIYERKDGESTEAVRTVGFNTGGDSTEGERMFAPIAMGDRISGLKPRKNGKLL